MGQYRMEIDLLKCVGCSACGMACKTGNNTQARSLGQTYNWADFIFETTGVFPDTMWQATPVMCNHCVNPACVDACPVRPDADGRKAVYKTADGIVAYDNTRCIGCRRCQRSCPYSVLSTRRSAPEAQFSVISYGANTSHAAWTDTSAVIAGCTASPKQVVDNAAVQSTPPNRTKWSHNDNGAQIRDVRAARTVEKCNMCVHRLGDSQLPYCAAACPAQARTVVEVADAADFPVGAKVLKPGSRNKAVLVDPATVTGRVKPQVYYVNSFSKR